MSQSTSITKCANHHLSKRASRWLPVAGAVSIMVGLSGCLPTFETHRITKDVVPVSAFEEIPTPFIHNWTEPSHPFTGAAILDVDGDGRHEIFVGGGRNQSDGLLSLRDGRLVNIINGSGLNDPNAATHGVASSDIDDDGDVDLIVARETGLTIYLQDNGAFTAQAVKIDLPQDSVPLSVAVADIDQDGDSDLYVSVFVSFAAFKTATFNDDDHAKKNIVLRNNGNLTFTDVTQSSGAKGLQNTFHSTFVNLDKDQDLDVVLAQNTGEVEIFENNGDGTFKSIPTRTGYGFWMGIGIGDIEQDGDQDIFVSNAGTSIPDFLTTGDLRDGQRHNTGWAVLRNDGGMVFTDAVAELGLDGYGFAWGGAFADVNLDGNVDLLVAQNYIKWPLHKIAPLPGKVLLQLDASEGRAFYSVPGLGLDNEFFAQSPLIGDIDGDGRPDVVWLNMNGPLRVLLNRHKSNFLTVRLPDAARTQGAVVSVTHKNGSVLRQQVVASTGLMTDSTADVYFGLGADGKVERVEVTTLNGTRRTIEGPEINRILTVDIPVQ